MYCLSQYSLRVTESITFVVHVKLLDDIDSKNVAFLCLTYEWVLANLDQIFDQKLAYFQQIFSLLINFTQFLLLWHFRLAFGLFHFWAIDIVSDLIDRPLVKIQMWNEGLLLGTALILQHATSGHYFLPIVRFHWFVLLSSAQFSRFQVVYLAPLILVSIDLNPTIFLRPLLKLLHQFQLQFLLITCRIVILILILLRQRGSFLSLLLGILLVEIDHSIAFFLVLFLLIGEVAVGLGEAHFAFLV